VLLRAGSYRAMAWKNGQGITREIDREPAEGAGAGDSFLWRLSIAEVAASGPFSLFAGYDRTITLIEGAGMVLDFDEAPARRLDRRFEPFGFSGDWHCRSTLLAGPVRDFNLMVDRARAHATTEVLRGTGSWQRSVAEGWLLLYCARGEIRAGEWKAGAGDSIRLGPGRHEVEARDGLALAMSVHIRRGR
jgi:environmental stress-induced protein Ves